MRGLLIDVVLATDLSKHIEYVDTLRQLAATHGHAAHAARGADAPAAWRSPFGDGETVDVKLLLGVAVKFADIGHSCKPAALHELWTERVTREFWALGDAERGLGVPLSPLCDREKDVNVPKSQVCKHARHGRTRARATAARAPFRPPSPPPPGPALHACFARGVP